MAWTPLIPLGGDEKLSSQPPMGLAVTLVGLTPISTVAYSVNIQTTCAYFTVTSVVRKRKTIATSVGCDIGSTVQLQ